MQKASVARVLSRERPDAVVVQGDTSSALMGAMAAVSIKMPVVHLEAGLRTYSHLPWPEERNRVLISKMTSLHLCHSKLAENNLLGEGYDRSSIKLVGGVGLDFLRQSIPPSGVFEAPRNFRALLTLHRRENGLREAEHVALALKRIWTLYGVRTTAVLHHNSALNGISWETMSDFVQVADPMSFPDFVQCMMNSMFIMSDSGGVQEEASYLGRPVLVLRENTERSEIVDAGGAIVVGANADAITAAVDRLVNSEDTWKVMRQPRSLYGSGNSAPLAAREMLYFVAG